MTYGFDIVVVSLETQEVLNVHHIPYKLSSAQTHPDGNVVIMARTVIQPDVVAKTHLVDETDEALDLLFPHQTPQMPTGTDAGGGL